MKDEFWKLITELLPVLKALQIMTSVMSAESQSSASCVFIMLSGLIKNHLTVMEDDSIILEEFKKMLPRIFHKVLAWYMTKMYKHLPGSDDNFKKLAYENVHHLIRQMPASLEPPATSSDAAKSEAPVTKRSRPNHAAVMFLLGDSASQQAFEDSDFENQIAMDNNFY